VVHGSKGEGEVGAKGNTKGGRKGMKGEGEMEICKREKEKGIRGVVKDRKKRASGGAGKGGGEIGVKKEEKGMVLGIDKKVGKEM